jgi:hypothetical protein
MSTAQAVYRVDSYAEDVNSSRPTSSREHGTNPFSTPHQSTPNIPLEHFTSRGDQSSIPLENLSSRPNPPELEVDLTAPENATSLPPADSGKAAWLFLVGATAIELLVWGIPFSIGVLHAYWTDELFTGRGSGMITLASTLQTGLLYMVAALSGP